MNGEIEELGLDQVNLNLECASIFDTLFRYWLHEYEVYRYVNDYEKQKACLDKLKKTLVFPCDSELEKRYRLLVYHMSLGVYFKDIGDLKSAQDEQIFVQESIPDPLEEPLKIFQNHNYSLQQLAEQASLKSNFNRAIQYLDYSIRLEEERAQKKGENPRLATMLAKKAALLEETGKIDSARQLYLKATDHFIEDYRSRSPEELSVYNYHFIGLLRKEVKFSLVNNDLERARYLLDEIDKLKTPDHPKNNTTFLLEAAYYDKMGIMDSSRVYFEKAYENIFRINANYDEKLNYFLTLATSNTYGKDDKKLQLLDQASAMTDSLKQTSFKWSKDMISSYTVRINYLYELGRPDSALVEIQELVDELNIRLSDAIIFEDHLNFIHEFYPILELGLDIIYKNPAEYKDLAFQIMECTKALSLYKATSISQISSDADQDSLLYDYKYLNALQSQFKLNIAQGKSVKENKNKLHQINESLQSVKSKLGRGRNKVSVDLKTYASSMAKSECHILSFSGENNYYFLTISKNTVELNRCSKYEIDEVAKNYLLSLKDFKSADYRGYAHQLYQLLKPTLDQVKSSKLTFSSDGYLTLIPIESLLDEEDHFLLHRFQIAYVPSAKIQFLLNFSAQSDSINSAIFRPREDENELPLDFAIWECHQVHKTIMADTFFDDQATKEAFIQSSELYNLLHLATHAKAVDNDPSLSYIRFTDGQLGFDEIRSLVLDVELVCLSACETNTGQNFTGEGVQSLARNFLASGAKSVVSSLWSIPDQTTSEITVSFYQYLKKGKSKSTSLKKAKLDFINNHPYEGSHPYYWAGLILTGKDTALFPNRNRVYWGIGSLAFLLLLLLSYKLLHPKRS